MDSTACIAVDLLLMCCEFDTFLVDIMLHAVGTCCENIMMLLLCCRYQTGRWKAAQVQLATDGRCVSSSGEHGSKGEADLGVVVTDAASSRSSAASSNNNSLSGEGGVVAVGESQTSHGGSLPTLRVKQ